MGLKGYKLWAMGQLDSNVQSPTAGSKLGLFETPPANSARLVSCAPV
jgi:hypothetical protein